MAFFDVSLTMICLRLEFEKYMFGVDLTTCFLFFTFESHLKNDNSNETHVFQLFSLCSLISCCGPHSNLVRIFQTLGSAEEVSAFKFDPTYSSSRRTPPESRVPLYRQGKHVSLLSVSNQNVMLPMWETLNHSRTHTNCTKDQTLVFVL